MERQVKQAKFRQIYGIVLLILTAAVALFFVVQVWRVYAAGKANGVRPFSPETVAAAFLEIALPFYLWLLSLIGGVVVAFICPAKVEVSIPNSVQVEQVRVHVGKGTVSPATQIARIRARLGEDVMPAAAKAECVKRIIYWCVGGVLIAFGAIMSLLYLLNGDNFGTVAGTNSEILSMAAHVLPWTVGGFVTATLCSILHSASLRVELSIWKSTLAEAARAGTLVKTAEGEDVTGRQENTRWLWIARAAVLAVALGLIVFGALNGGLTEVFKKAVILCTECVGLA